VSEARPAVFLDRDGTLIREREYLSDPKGVEFLPGVPESLVALREAGFALVIVTNQSGIGRGLYSLADYRRVEAELDRRLSEVGSPVDGTWFCPHHPDHTGPCDCRKPGTGMHRAAVRELNLDPGRSYFVGDKLSDLEPTASLGGQGILVRTGYGAEMEPRISEGMWVADDLPAAAALILASGERRGAT